MPIGFKKDASVRSSRQQFDDDAELFDSIDGSDGAKQPRAGQNQFEHAPTGTPDNRGSSRAELGGDNINKKGHKEQKDGLGDGRNPPNRKKLVIACSLAAAVLIVVCLTVAFRRRGDSRQPVSSNSEIQQSMTEQQDAADGQIPFAEADADNSVFDEDGNLVYNGDNKVVGSDAIDPGIPDFDNSQNKTTTGTVEDADGFIKDLNGVDISMQYNVESRYYVTDYVSYTSHRAIMDDGMELYWLETVYKGKKYRVQVPFVYFKDLGETGACKVQIEVLNIEGGGKVISYMQVMNESRDS